MRGEALAAKIERLSIPEPNTGCHLWLGSLNAKGYGTARGTLVHRLVFVESYGPVPHGLEINHRCRIRCCVNPLHLEAISHVENIAFGKRHRARCKRGHAFEGENLYIYPPSSPQAGIRRCATCIAALERKRARRQLARSG